MPQGFKCFTRMQGRPWPGLVARTSIGPLRIRLLVHEIRARRRSVILGVVTSRSFLRTRQAPRSWCAYP